MRPCLVSFSLTLAIGHALAAAQTKPAAPTAPPLALEGVVLAPDSRPVEGAVVTARRTGSREEPLFAQTDTQGAFRIVLQAGGLLDLRVEKSGLIPATLARVRPGRPLTVRLEKGGVITGIVRDGTTRRAVVGARVEALEEGASAPQRTAAGEAGTITATTDARGRFELAGIGLKLMNVSAVAPGYSRATRSNVRVGANVALTLFSGASISGVVAGVDGKPVTGALVMTEPETGFGREALPRTEITDARGRFVVAGVHAGRYSVMARAQDMAPGVVWVNLEPNTDTPVELHIGPGATLRGRLVNVAGDAVKGGRVAVQGTSDQPTPMALQAMLRADAGADGRFRIERMPLGSHSLAVTAAGLAMRRVDLTLETDTDLGDIALESGLSIRGRVRDRTGAGIAGASLRGFLLRGGAGPGLEATSENGGSFAVGGLDAGTYRVTVEATGYGNAVRSLVAGAEVVDIVLDAAGAVTGCVVEAGARPVISYRVAVQPTRRSEAGTFVPPPRVEPVGAADGCFRVENVAEGVYSVNVSAPEHPPASVSNVNVARGATTDVGRIRLGVGGVIRGMVVDSAGAPILGATVSIVGQSSSASDGSTATGVEGVFELSGLAPGTVELTAVHPEYAEGHASGIEVDPAQGPAEARIVLSAGGRIEGALRRRDGLPVAKARVAIMPLPAAGGFAFAPDMLRPLRDDGSFSSEHVAPGRYRVMVMLGDRSLYSNAQQRDVEVQEGETTSVDFVAREILVTGHVTRAGVPAPNLRVTLQPQQLTGVMTGAGTGTDVPDEAMGPRRLSGTTREDGSYELLADEPGKYSSRVGTADGQTSFPGREVALPDADAFALDFDIAGVSLAGVVVEQATGRPLANASVLAQRKKQDGLAGASGVTGPDGRFALEVEPGEYVVQAQLQGYGDVRQEVTLPEGGLDGLRLTLVKGVAITGKVVDAAGRGVGNALVVASSSAIGGTGSSGMPATSLEDGSFRLEGLSEEPYDISASRDGRFALRRGVTPGDAGVTLLLRSGGRALITVQERNGRPVEGAWVFGTVNGVPVPGGMTAQSDANGTIDMAVPAGNVTVEVRKDRRSGRATFDAIEGAVVPVSVVLSQSGS
jgi:hypothetical protein